MLFIEVFNYFLLTFYFFFVLLLIDEIFIFNLLHFLAKSLCVLLHRLKIFLIFFQLIIL